jgi:hypothetical protein
MFPLCVHHVLVLVCYRWVLGVMGHTTLLHLSQRLPPLPLAGRVDLL